jgi:hypothetical protein
MQSIEDESGSSNMNERVSSKLHGASTTRFPSGARRLFVGAFMALAILGAHGAHAQDAAGAPLGESSCENDVKTMQARRMKLIDEFNKMAKSHGGKLDPIESCPKLKNLAAIEASFKTYMVKNKDWCNIPDDAIANVTDSQSKTAALATRVCAVAVQFKKQQEMQAAGGGFGAAAAPKLPAGPL